MPTDTFTLPGLSGPASILLDKWGMAQIRAETVKGAFFV